MSSSNIELQKRCTKFIKNFQKSSNLPILIVHKVHYCTCFRLSINTYAFDT